MVTSILYLLTIDNVMKEFDTQLSVFIFNIVVGDLVNVALDPILIFTCHMGVTGAAIAHVLSQ